MPRPELDIILDSHDANVFRSAQKRLGLTHAALLTQIVHEWATHPARRPGNTQLPLENSVLYRGERFTDFIQRIKKATIQTVLTQEHSNFSRTARRFGMDRSAFYKLWQRFKDQIEGTVTPSVSFSDEAANLDLLSGFSPLADAIQGHALCALELSAGDKEQAAHLLLVSTDQLDQILNETAISWISSDTPISQLTKNN